MYYNFNRLLSIFRFSIPIMLTSITWFCSCKSADPQASAIDWTSSADLDNLAEGMCIGDVTNSHNPHMIAIWGGTYTKSESFLRSYREDPALSLENALVYFYAATRRYPRNIAEVDELGYFPIRPVDPIIGNWYKYGDYPGSQRDFMNIGIETSSDRDWIITLYRPINPEGEWKKEVDSLNVWIDQDKENGYLKQLADEYGNDEAMRGAILSDQLRCALRSYVYRRNKMPTNANALLDGIWVVAENWAEYDATVDVSSPGVFCFGIDSAARMACAYWRDTGGKLYTAGFQYNPWPDSGWTHVPTYTEYIHRFDPRLIMFDSYSSVPDGLGITYIPPIILWKCKLQLQSRGPATQN